MRVGINGFGRIGRLAARVMVEKPHINLVAINSSYDAEYLAYQFMYDSVHGTFKGTVDVDGGDLILNGKRVKIHKTRDVKAIPWKDLGAEYICESTGQFLDTPSCTGHLQNGAKKVVITAPAKDKETPSIVLGVNTHAYNHETMHVVSAASCTTHGLAPIAKVIHEEFGIEHGLMSTIHAMTATQKVVDASSKKDWRSGRAASVNIIPSSTGAAKSIGLCIPELKGKLSGMAYRVPVPDVSVVDLVCQLQRDVTYEEVCDTIKRRSETDLKGFLKYEKMPLVSQDFVGSVHSTHFDEKASMLINKRLLKVVCWYDNEHGYAHRIVELMEHMAKKDGAI